MQTPPPTPPTAPLPAPSFFFGRRTGAPLVMAAATGEEVQITPESLVLLIYARFWGFVWNWPLAVSVQRGGQIERKPVVDVTQLALWGLGLSTALLSLLLLRRRERA